MLLSLGFTLILILIITYFIKLSVYTINEMFEVHKYYMNSIVILGSGITCQKMINIKDCLVIIVVK